MDEVSKKVQKIRSPQINPNSKKLIQEKYGNFPQKRVDQRLYDDHHKRQIAKDMREKLEKRHNEEMAYPNTSSVPTSSYHSAQMLTTGDGKEIVNRLMDYKSKYTEHERNLKKKYDDQE